MEIAVLIIKPETIKPITPSIGKSVNKEIIEPINVIEVGQTHTNLIFDVIISDKYRDKNQMLKEKIDEQLKLIDNKLETVITFDSQF